MALAHIVKGLLAHPLTRGLDLDDPALTHIRRRVIREKPFLEAIYDEWYRWISGSLPGGTGPVLELGSGAGFLSEHIPDLVTSEVFPCEGVSRVVDARALPFRDGELRAVVMTDVLHHIPDAAAFLREVSRALVPGGAVLMIEPWVTPMSRVVWTRLHHEPFEPDASEWAFPPSGPLSGANTALPWMIFARDRHRLDREFPRLAVRSVEPIMPLRYLVSGGVSMRNMQPAWATAPWSWLEAGLSPFNDHLAMFAKIDLRHR